MLYTAAHLSTFASHLGAMPYITVYISAHYSTSQYIALHIRPFQHIRVQNNALQSFLVHLTKLQNIIAVDLSALQCIAAHPSTFQYSAVHLNIVHYISAQCRQHLSTVQYISTYNSAVHLSSLQLAFQYITVSIPVQCSYISVVQCSTSQYITVKIPVQCSTSQHSSVHLCTVRYLHSIEVGTQINRYMREISIHFFPNMTLFS